MSIERVAGVEAINRLRTEGRRVRWPDHREPDRRMDGVVTVTSKPGFEIHPADRVFTMGSCFARNIELRLTEIGLETVMYDESLIADLEQLGHDRWFTNKYNSAAIRAELSWALGSPAPPEEHVLLPTERGVHDLFANPKWSTQSLEVARSARRIVESRAARIRDCRIVVLTLGLAEVWYDSVSGLHINAAPPKASVLAEPDRFFVDVYSYQQILDDLEAIHTLLERHGHPDFHVLITVSPVPMSMTFRALDAMTANTYSKAVQRAAIEAFVVAHDNVNYFPSFESITLTDRRIAFRPDNRHVQQEVVSQIVDRFVADYAPQLQFQRSAAVLQESEAMSAKDFAVSGKLCHEERKFKEAADHYLRALAIDDDSRISRSRVRVKLASCLYKLGRLEEARAALEAIIPDPDAGIVELLGAARWAGVLGAADLEREALQRAQAMGASEDQLASLGKLRTIPSLSLQRAD